MTSTETTDHGLTYLSYTQLTDALAASHGHYDDRFTDFLTACQNAKIAAETGGHLDELRAEMDTRWAAVTAQAAMTRAITAEITGRIERRDYA